MTRAVADAAARWRDPAFPPRVRALAGVASRTGYSIPVVTYAFDRLFESVTLDALESTIAREIGGRRTEPLGRVAVISSRTTIGVAIVPAIFALCAGCDVLVKDREDDLVRSFFQTLDDNVTFEAQAWEGPSRDLSPFDAVVAFGGDDALRAIRAQLAPTARFIPYGPKASIGYIVREALRDDIASRQIADGAARDLVLYDGEGCLSLHVLFVERGGSIEPERFAEILAAAVVDAERAFPIGTRDPAAAAGVAQARDLASFRGETVYSNAAATFLIAMGSQERPPEFLPRAIAIVAVEGPEQMAEYVARHRPPLEACALAGQSDGAVAAVLDAGANRIVRFGELQSPPLDYPHGGRPRIAEFVRFVTVTA